jgi:hypothetical protein
MRESIVRSQRTSNGGEFFNDEAAHKKRVKKNLMNDYMMYIT